jgi:hypothetical protein
MTTTITEATHSFPLTGEIPSKINRGPVTASLTYFLPPVDGSAPFGYVETPPAGQPKYNYGSDIHEVEISDLRGQESEFSLAKNAFAAISNVASAETEFSSDEHIKTVYYPEVEDLILKNVPGAKRVLLFDHTIRRANPNADRAPVIRVHIDQTASAAAARVRFHLLDEADELLKGRYRIINVWRPINGAVESFPLAVADTTTLQDEDVISVEHRYPDRVGETAGIKYNKGTKWYYWSGIGNDERLLLQCSDSENLSSRAPHSAFVDPRSGEHAKPRESIEVRALVFG